jgi:hypothetical protein
MMSVMARLVDSHFFYKCKAQALAMRMFLVTVLAIATDVDNVVRILFAAH